MKTCILDLTRQIRCTLNDKTTYYHQIDTASEQVEYRLHNW